jgi:hypothetical protein
MKGWQLVSVIILTAAVFIPRVQNLDAFRSPDEDRWIANTNGFTHKLAHGNLEALVQQPHPGITTQWLGALTIGAESRAVKKLPLAIGQSFLILIAGYVYGRLWGKVAGLATIAALAANPLLYAHTRIYAMDSLLALFCALTLGFLLLWRKEKGNHSAIRYLIASAFCTAAAILSKLSGIALLPIIGGALLYWLWRDKPQTTNDRLQAAGIWFLAFVCSCLLILPSFAIVPENVIGDFMEFFRSDDYQKLHQLENSYYLGTLVFFSTPLHWVALIALVWLLFSKKLDRLSREQLVILLAFAVLMVVQMTLGAKKGDRYILPSFVILDIIAAWVLAKVYQVFSSKYQVVTTRKYFIHITLYLLLATLVWQVLIIWQTHPHTLAYVNPLSRHWFGERRHGWGEGLDLAATYLNQKPNADQLKIATYYPAEVAPYFAGEAVPAHQHENESIDYVVIYRAMFGRGEAYETDVVNAWKTKTPEKVIELSGVPMVWVYSASDR